MSLDPPHDSHSQHYRDPWTGLDNQQATEAVKSRVLAARISTVFYPSAPQSPSPSPCHLRRGAARPCSYLPLLPRTPSLPPTFDLKPRGPSTTFRPRLLSCLGGCLYPAPVWAWSKSQADIPAPNHGLPFFFFSFSFLPLLYPTPPLNLFWPGLPSDRQPNLSSAAFSDQLQPLTCYTYTHEGLYVLTKTPGSGSITTALRRLCLLGSRSTAVRSNFIT